MSWQDRMETAQFRGVWFLTEGHDSSSGRRIVVHQYPGGEFADAEDLGAQAWDYKLNAYFIGPDYDIDRDNFLYALNQPGADWLTHPWLGRVWVRAKRWSVAESNEKGGMCTIVLEFVPGGGDVIAPARDVADDAQAKLEAYAGEVEEDFALKTVDNDSFGVMVAEAKDRLEILRKAISLATLPLTWANEIINMIQSTKNDIEVLLGLPDKYSATIRTLGDLLGGADGQGDDMDDNSRPPVVTRLASTAKTPGTISASSAALRTNLVAEDALRRRMMWFSAAQLALADYRTAPARDACLAAVLDALATLLPDMPDPVFQAAVSARAALVAALEAQDLESGISRDVVHPLPSTLLAHRMGVDDADFIARNGVRHPLFVQGRVYD